MKLTLQLYFKLQQTTMKSFLFWFSNEHSNFRMPELEALFKLFNLDRRILASHKSTGPFVVLDFPNEDSPRQIMSRSVLAHSCFELWSEGNSLDEVHKNLKENINVFRPYSRKSFSIRVETFGKKIPQREKLYHIETFDYIPLEGKVDLVNPELSLNLLHYYGQDPNNAPRDPLKLYFGRWITDGQRRLAYTLSLKTRKFIGNTSMDPLLSLVMANLAGIDKDDIVCDPFVGTGSLLVASAAMGGFVCGGDIDYLMLHGRTRPTRARQESRANDESVRANLRQYGVESKYLDVIVADASKPLWRPDFRFDVIITDPPYGIREPAERIGSLKGPHKIKEEHLAQHVPSKIDYSLCEIYTDLIDFGARYLKMNGRLVFWIPIARKDYEAHKLPKNPCFNMMSNSEQELSTCASRRLLVFEKIAEPTEETQTVIDDSALMYRFKFFDPDNTKCRNERKLTANRCFRERAKLGVLSPSS